MFLDQIRIHLGILIYIHNFDEGLLSKVYLVIKRCLMGYAFVEFITGTVLWLLVLEKYPFNMDVYKPLIPIKNKYEKVLKILGTLSICYSVFLACSQLPDIFT